MDEEEQRVAAGKTTRMVGQSHGKGWKIKDDKDGQTKPWEGIEKAKKKMWWEQERRVTENRTTESGEWWRIITRKAENRGSGDGERTRMA